MSKLSEQVSKAAKYLQKDQKNAEQDIWDALKDFGVTDTDLGYEILLSPDSMFGDARAIFCERRGIPIAVFRSIWRVLREGGQPEVQPVQPTDGLTTLIGYMRPIGQMPDHELLEKYNPDCAHDVIEELIRRVGAQKNCIIFMDDNKTVNIQETLSLFKDAKKRPDMPAHFKKGDKVFRLYPIGDFPEVTCDVCPVTGEVMIGNYSSIFGIEWIIPLEARQFIAVMVSQGLKLDRFKIEDMQTKYVKEGINGLRLMFPDITIIFDELKQLNQLPTLKSKRIMTQKKAYSNSPFGTRIIYES
jgi:hypothetical protein